MKPVKTSYYQYTAQAINSQRLSKEQSLTVTGPGPSSCTLARKLKKKSLCIDSNTFQPGLSG